MYKKIIATLFLVIGAVSTAHSASFDCTKATQVSEKMVCANPILSKLDDQMFALYSQVKNTSSNPDQLKNEQINWIKEIRSCGNNEACVIDLYNKRITQLSPTPQQQPAVSSNDVQPQVINPVNSSTDVQNQSSTSQSSTSVARDDSDDGSALGFFLVGILTLILAFGSAAYFVSSVRKTVPAIPGNRFVRNTNNGEIFSLLIFSVVASFSWVASVRGGVSAFGVIISLLLTGVVLLIAKAFAVTEAGVAYDANNDLIEIEASGKGDNSFFDKFKLSYWTSSLRRVRIPVSDIRSISGWTGVTETTRYNEHSKSLDTTTTYSHTLNLVTTDADWSITFSNRKKYDAAHTLICEVANLG